MLSFDKVLHSIGRVARRNAQRKKKTKHQQKTKPKQQTTLQGGQRTERRKWKGRQGHELWFHLHSPPQFFHRKVCVAIKQWGQLLKHALSHWTARQESINSLLLTNRSRTHTQGMGQCMLFKNNSQEGNSPPHTHTCSLLPSQCQQHRVTLLTLPSYFTFLRVAKECRETV